MITLALFAFSSALLFTQEKERNIIPTTNTIGYHPIPLNENVNKDPFDGLDWKKNMRIAAFPAATPVTHTEAEKIIIELKKKGINIILGSIGWYLFADTEDDAKEFGYLAQTFSNTIRYNFMISEICHKYGLKYIIHQTSTMVSKSFLEKHPEYAAIDIRTGNKIKTGYSSFQVACINSEDFQKEYFRRLEIMLNGSHADGLMQDEIAVWWGANNYHVCGCYWCRKKVSEELKVKLPEIGDLENIKIFHRGPDFMKFAKWQGKKLGEVNKHIQELIQKCMGTNAIRISYRCNNLIISSPINGNLLSDIVKYYDSFGYECEPPGYFYKGYFPHVITEMKHMDAYAEWTGNTPWTLFYPKNISQYIWCWMLSMSQGSRIWWRVDRTDIAAAWQPALRWEEIYQKILAGSRPYTEVGVFLSENTKEFRTDSHGGAKYMNRFTALCEALLDSNIPYRVILSEDLVNGKFYNLKLIFSAGALYMSIAETTAIKKFVNGGGTFVASGKFTLYDDFGKEQNDFLLADLFGVSYKGEIHYTNAELRYNLSGKALAQQNIVPYRGKFFDVEVVKGEIKGHFYDKESDSEFPGIVVNKFGLGKSVYCAEFFEDGYFFYYGNNPKFESGKIWIDQRDNLIKNFVADIVTAYAGNILRVKNSPDGLLVEPRLQPLGKEKILQIHIANFCDGVMKTGLVTENFFNNISYPELALTKPDKKKPVEIDICKDTPVEKIIMISPDFDGALNIPFSQKTDRVIFNLPEIYTYGLILLLNNEQFISLNSHYAWKIITDLNDIKKPIVEINDIAFLFAKGAKTTVILKDDFDDEKKYWIKNNCSTELTTENSHSGKSSLKMTDNGGSSQIFLNLETQIDKKYKFSAWGYNNSSNKGAWRGKIAVSTVSGYATSDKYLSSSDFIVENDTWVQLDCFFKAVSTNTYFMLMSQNSTGDVTYFDSLEISMLE